MHSKTGFKYCVSCNCSILNRNDVSEGPGTPSVHNLVRSLLNYLIFEFTRLYLSLENFIICFRGSENADVNKNCPIYQTGSIIIIYCNDQITSQFDYVGANCHLYL